MKKLIGLLVVGIMTIGLCACGASVGIAPQNADKYTAGNAEIKEKVESLEVEWEAGALTIVPGETSSVILEETYNGDLPDEKKMHWYLDGTTLKVRYDMSLGTGTNASSKKLKVTLPKDLKLKYLEVAVASSDVTAENLQAEDAQIASASGDIKASFQSALNSAEIASASGEAKIVFAEAVERLEMSAASGDIRIEAKKEIRDVEIGTASGSVTAAFAATPDDFEIGTASGDVEVSLPSDADLSMEIDTASGDFNSEIPFAMSGSRYIAGSGKAAGEIHTASGDIRILAG